jgi:hypothetical protein
MSRVLAVSEDDFRAAATDAELLRFFVNYAILAPSGHNTQPWLFRIGGRNLELLADRRRAGSSPHDFEVEELRPRLRQAIGIHGMPQLLMRFGYGPATQSSVRRPIETVVM